MLRCGIVFAPVCTGNSALLVLSAFTKYFIMVIKGGNYCSNPIYQ
jgi:hypothetical protein